MNVTRIDVEGNILRIYSESSRGPIRLDLSEAVTDQLMRQLASRGTTDRDPNAQNMARSLRDYAELIDSRGFNDPIPDHLRSIAGNLELVTSMTFVENVDGMKVARKVVEVQLSSATSGGPGQTVKLEAWPEHGCWYEVGRVDEIGALWAPYVDGQVPYADEVGEIEVRYADA